MFGLNPCSTYLVDELAKIYNIIASNEWKLVLFSLGGARIVIHYCNKSPYYEAREVKAAAILFSIMVILIAAAEWRAPALVRQVLACKAPETKTRFAAAQVPPGAPRFGFQPGR